MTASDKRKLKRVVGLPGAVLLGLGSIVGTGAFVSLGLAAGTAGAWMLPALATAALLALFNGLSTAQLAASHPASGGTYEYGYAYLSPSLGFTAGWMFLCAKSASAATAALGCAGYLLEAAGKGLTPAAPPACLLICAAAALTLSGMRRSNAANALIVAASLSALALFSFSGAGTDFGTRTLSRETFPGIRPFLHACALLFVAYTGYGRIATLGEEVAEPERTIPRAVFCTLAVSLLVYLGTAGSALGLAGAPRFFELTVSTGAPLEAIALDAGKNLAARALAAGAVAAMFGVLLNLILGLSRVLLAMGRRGDMPGIFARLDASGGAPAPAVLAASVLIALLAALGSVKTAWSFSAFTVLVYYALTNLAALRLPEADRRFPRWTAYGGLAGCCLLAFFVEPRIWAAGLALIAAGLLWRAAMRPKPTGPSPLC